MKTKQVILSAVILTVAATGAFAQAKTANKTAAPMLDASYYNSKIILKDTKAVADNTFFFNPMLVNTNLNAALNKAYMEKYNIPEADLDKQIILKINSFNYAAEAKKVKPDTISDNKVYARCRTPHLHKGTILKNVRAEAKAGKEIAAKQAHLKTVSDSLNIFLVKYKQTNYIKTSKVNFLVSIDKVLAAVKAADYASAAKIAVALAK